MEHRIFVDFKSILKTFIKKWWLYLIVFVSFLFGGFLMANSFSEENITHTAIGKILVTQQKNEETGEIMDNAARLQPAYDATEVIKSGVFFEHVKEKLSFDITTQELRDCVSSEMLLPTRTLKLAVVGEDLAKVEEILNAVQKTAEEYLPDILPSVNVEVLETTETIQIQQQQKSVNGMKIGILMGMAGCIILTFLLGALYLLNSAVKYKDDAESSLGMKVLAEFPMKTRG
ncbi:hypothetical protein JQM69_08455 [Faecalicatena contorta]|uniref:Wzz/FepE/Etk N-terminal domain-containing protein n=1 Tax=Faecalicatena contorta TaxID=39482 RepID=UPI001F3F44C3|nr:Wzz/FepE/Etk N-terminal domain-containing protein [Faecalicatena contorta]MCF2680720.1 hypothetical protein [Faecalicatena contorta]